MLPEDAALDETSCLALLRASSKNKDLHWGSRVHANVLKWGLLGKSSYITSALISLYSKCGFLAKARNFFDGLPLQDVISWTAIISAYGQYGHGQEALDCFQQMLHKGFSPNAVTFTCILKACGSLGEIDKGEKIHDEISRQGLLQNNPILGNALVDMYAKCGVVAKARQVLEKLPVRDAYSWNALIAGYAEQSQGQDAWNCLELMRRDGLSPNAVTFTCILKACGSIGAVDKGEQIHDEICRWGLLGTNALLGNALVDMYAKCGAFAKALCVLEKLPFVDVVTWSSIISGYAQQGRGEEALHCYQEMRQRGLFPDVVTFTCILRACASIGAADKGEQIHNDIAKEGLLRKNVVLGNALVSMYAQCGVLAKAKKVLNELPVRNVVSWSALILGYVQHDQAEKAFHCFEMMQCESILPNTVTFIGVLKACGTTKSSDKGYRLHYEIVRRGFLRRNSILGTALVDMYAKSGAVVKARRVFDELSMADVVCWNALIAGYVEHDRGEEALRLFEHMQQNKGLSPDATTLICIGKACGSLGAIAKGEQIHYECCRQDLLRKDMVLGTVLVDMYAKCGALLKARSVLEDLTTRDVISWSVLITGYVRHGHGEEALICCHQMQQRGFSVDSFAFSSMLSAFNLLGLVDEGQMFFSSMGTKFGIKPVAEHHVRMVSLLGHAGNLRKAVAIVQQMPSHETCAIWPALSANCAKWGDVKIGRWAIQHSIRLYSSDAASQVNSPTAAAKQYGHRTHYCIRNKHVRGQGKVHKDLPIWLSVPQTAPS